MSDFVELQFSWFNQVHVIEFVEAFCVSIFAYTADSFMQNLNDTSLFDLYVVSPYWGK